MARILIFEDDVEFADLMSDALASDGHEVHSTFDIDEAVEMVVAGSIDLAIVDIFVRKNGVASADNGFMLIARMKSAIQNGKHRKTLRVPVIIISGSYFPEAAGRRIKSRTVSAGMHF